MKDMSKLQSEIYSEIFTFYGPCYYILICYIMKAFFKEKNKIRLLKYISPWMNLENIILNLTAKGKYCMISLIV